MTYVAAFVLTLMGCGPIMASIGAYSVARRTICPLEAQQHRVFADTLFLVGALLIALAASIV